MKTLYVSLLSASMFFAVSANCQNQLYFENFNGVTNTFTLNDNELGSNKGNNEWIVDTNYFAGGIYPNTTNESKTYAGSITGAPYSPYLHIYDSLSGYLNDLYNPNDSSTRFAHMTSGICTKALTNVNFNFFYLCPSVKSYGTVWYSVDGGPWTSTKDTLRNRVKWQYVTLTNPAFNNVSDLRFGFLWHNNKTAGGHDTSSLGIDDVSLYGTYDSVGHPIKCTFATLSSDSCLGGNAYVYFTAALSDSTCNAQWTIKMSNGNGMGFSGEEWAASIGPAYGNDLYSVWFLQIPANFENTGDCFRFTFTRTTYPYITLTDSFCFPFDSCPGTITTEEPPFIALGQANCAGNVIDVPFITSGIFDANNIYYAQLIDSIGHTAKIDTIGSLVSDKGYPYPPGDISGLIPLTVPAGCNYYVRVVSSTPNRAPIKYGPFCIQHCDILTNQQKDVQACLKSCTKQPRGYYDTITYKIHEYDSRAHYHIGNEFESQLLYFSLYPVSCSVINTGLFGVKVDTTTSKIYLHVPCPDTLSANGISPGVYYMRVIADNSNYPDSAFGSLIYLTIGEPADSVYITYTPPAGPYCDGSIITFTANPSDYNSTYNWAESSPHSTYQWPDEPYSLGLNLSQALTFQFSVQENNYGCLGTKAVTDSITVLGLPNITKKGPTKICLEDTATYSIPLANNTNYTWRIGASAYTDITNNQLKIKFNNTGTFRISVVASNACFTDSAVWSVKVTPDSLCNTSVSTITAAPEVNIYPNPNSGTFMLNITLPDVGYTSYMNLNITNELGQLIYSNKSTISGGNFSKEINLNSQASGVYFVQIEIGSTIINKKLLLMR